MGSIPDDLIDLMDEDAPAPDGVPDQTSAFYTFDKGKKWTSAEHIEVAKVLPPGVYRYGYDNAVEFHGEPPQRSRIHLDDDQAAIIGTINRFWESGEKYRNLGFPHKRGLLLYGPPGTGKTTCMRALSDRVVKRGGYVLLYSDPGILTYAIKAIRSSTPDAPLLIQIEDLDRWIGTNAEGQLLDAMDGSFRGEHLLWVATTNSRAKLSERMVRPSRFDMKIEVGYPTESVRRHYINGVLPKAEASVVDELVATSDGKSIADIKEIIIQRTVFA